MLSMDKDFIIALRYKAEIIKDYFANLSQKSRLHCNLKSGAVTIHKASEMDWNVTLVDTGLDTMTGGRVKRLKEYLGEDDFMLTYGDGLADIKIPETIDFHKQHGKPITMTAVRPAARFGELDISGNFVRSFEEKPQMHEGWINGGFFVCSTKILDHIEGDHEMLERQPLQRIIESDGIAAFKHDGFWQCMASKRDNDKLSDLWDSGLAPGI